MLVTADLATFYQIWLGRISFFDALKDGLVEIDAIPTLADAFLTWFAYSHAAATVRAVAAQLPIEK